MLNRAPEEKPVRVALAVKAIWLTIWADALMTVFGSESGDGAGLVFNFALLLVYAAVAHRISSRSNWARLTYAFLVALEFAALLAFGMGEASELEVLITYLTLPLEAWILFNLFSAASDQWFAPGPANRA
jgi:hypothetical protein